MAKFLPEDNPFNPGSGAAPPYLVGRKKERQLIEEALDLIVQPLVKGKLTEQPMWPIKLIGLHGSGKTALLGFALEQAQQRDIHVLSYDHLPHMEPWDNYDRMVQRMLADRAREKNTAVQNESGARDQQCEKDFPLLLEEMVREKPVLLLLDEPWPCDERQLAVLLLEIQRMQFEDLPLAVLITGTPILDKILSLFNPSLIDHAVNRYIHHLSDEEVREALREPFTQRGVEVSEEALDLLATWTGNYPCFIQMAGAKAWDAMEKAGRSELDIQIAQQVEPAMQEARDDYYQSVLAKMKRGDLLDYASHVIALIEAAEQPLYPEQLRGRLAEAAGLEDDRCRVVFVQLLGLGLIWLTKQHKVVAGLPSFFTFFKARQQAAEV